MHGFRPRARHVALLVLILLLVCVWQIVAYAQRYSQLTKETEDEAAIAAPDRADVTYCTSNGAALKMDLYFPADGAKAPRPAAVYVHGGAWVGGDKRKGSGLEEIPEVVKRGYVVAAVNYRLARQSPFPASIQDVKCAIRSLRAHASDYGIDPLRIGIWGGSAGGHLASLAGLAGPEAGFDVGEYLDQSSRVSAVVDMFGPADLTARNLSPLQTLLLNQAFGTTDTSSPLLKQASPVSYIGGASASGRASAGAEAPPPFLILQGEADDVVPAAQSQLFYDQLTAGGIQARLVMVKNANHNFAPTGGAISPSRAELTRLTADFLAQYLR